MSTNQNFFKPLISKEDIDFYRRGQFEDKESTLVGVYLGNNLVAIGTQGVIRVKKEAADIFGIGDSVYLHDDGKIYRS
jgi:hypothetical protein